VSDSSQEAAISSDRAATVPGFESRTASERPVSQPRLSVDLSQRSLCRSGDDITARFETRTVARAIPRTLGRIPGHGTTHVRADGRSQCDGTGPISIGSDLRAVPFEDLSLSPL